MAHVYHYPVATWTHPSGMVTAVLAEEPGVVAVRATLAEALGELQDYLTFLHRSQPWLPGPELDQLNVTSVAVKLRAEYQLEGRVFPVEPPLELRFPCLSGPHESGLWMATLPTLELQFLYQEGRDLKELVQHYVQDRLAGQTPGQLLRHAPPPRVELARIGVRVRRTAPKTPEPGCQALEAVADRLGPTSFKNRVSRAYRRETVVDELNQRLSDQQASVLLVGPSGAGKTAVVLEAARRHRKLSLWLTSAGRMVAGMSYLGQWEERCEALIADLTRCQGALCVENLLELVRIGGAQPTSSVAAFLAPYLERGELQLVAEASPEELEACRRLLPGLVDLFQVLPVPAFNPSEAIEVLQQVAGLLEQQTRVAFDPGVEHEVYRVFARFAPYRAFPGAGATFMRELAETCPRVDRAAVLRHFSQRTGLSEVFLRDDLTLEAEAVLTDLESQVVGQPVACRVAADLVTTFKASMNDPERPLGVLLFCGPTGVGKTELARTLARTFFGASGEERLVRLDMSEYAGSLAAERLLGHLSGQPSRLVRELRRQPFSVVLLDEIEKAHPEVFDVLLRVMDEGCLTDTFGRATWFRSAVLVMTSNLGAESLRQAGLTPRTARGSYESAAMTFFRPEFYNRIDSLVQFEPLKPQVIAQLARKELKALERRQGLEQRELRLEPSPEVLNLLTRQGYDHRYGARPLQRTVETLIVRPLAELLLRHPELGRTVLRIELDPATGEVRLTGG
ncbi:ATP-dependent Clp protease ATP-binding subunit [bacterium CPR1]|nr:ATP-dependent Clp protease ATP-binding subunit [bacterium CPR1]